jgi:hypothetical protein
MKKKWMMSQQLFNALLLTVPSAKQGMLLSGLRLKALYEFI